MNRRTFLTNTAGLALAAAASKPLRAAATASPNGRITLGLIGLGARGTALLQMLVAMPDVEIAYLCDVDRGAFSRATAIMQDARGAVPKRVQDMREIFADKSVDAVVIATGHNWHALATIWACQAGKDVYVEKPMALTLAEGRKMVQAARKYGRVVQVGSQTESAPYFRHALDYVRAGKLGALRLGRTTIMEPNHASHEHPPAGQSAPVPAGLNWDMFCGPAALVPYWPGRWWGDYWNFTLGGMIDHSAHQISMIRQFLDLPAPKSACTVGRIMTNAREDRHWKFPASPPGGVLREPSERWRDWPSPWNQSTEGRSVGEVDARVEIFDTCYALFESEKQDVIFEGMHWTPYGRTPYSQVQRRDNPRAGGFPDWIRSSRVEILGSEAFLVTARHAGGWEVFDRGDQSVAGEMNRKEDTHHLRNFLDCMRTRAKPNSDVEIAHVAMTYNHLMVASYRAGNVKLLFDAATEKVTNVPDANKFLTRSGRGEFTIPDTV